MSGPKDKGTCLNRFWKYQKIYPKDKRARLGLQFCSQLKNDSVWVMVPVSCDVSQEPITNNRASNDNYEAIDQGVQFLSAIDNFYILVWFYKLGRE